MTTIVRVVLCGLVVLPAASQSATITIWSGVYTVRQSERGQKAYGQSCSSCHRDDLSGSDDGAPALRGPVFVERWRDRPLSEMYFVLAESMPQDSPGSLSGKEYADIIAFMLSKNEVPSGESELSPEMEKLKRIVFTEKRNPR
ncbi:MAG TPA: cytochrome c [Vicinamibacterales bacterium]|jgi:mono/diheme cytochrome c family protein|nr:cytochrome c [Vicinamibacterales bacterium]